MQHLMRACFPASPFAYCDADDALLADVTRYLILYQEGGLYVDRDFECFEAFDSLVENEQLCLIGDPNRFPGQPCSDALLFSTRGHPFLRFLLEQAGMSKCSGNKGDELSSTGCLIAIRTNMLSR